MTVKDDLHHLVDELDDAAARQALLLLQDLQRPHTLREALSGDEERRRAAEEAEIDAEYERAYAEHPFTEQEHRVHEAMLRLSVEALRDDLAPKNG